MCPSLLYLPPLMARRCAALVCTAGLIALTGSLTGCAGRPEAPILEQPAGKLASETAVRLDAVLPADVLLLGEQHDVAAHHQIEQQVVALLAARGLLAAVTLEMADSGVSTATLKPSANEQQVRNALKWSENAWPWADYGPAIMTAVRAEVPVLGANLPREQMRSSMADTQLDGKLPGPALKAQQQGIRIGHCGLLPESQITPMTRIQISRDITMAHTLHQASMAGKVVLLLAGHGHVDRQLGVPQHLPIDLKVKAIHLRAGEAQASDRAEAFDSVWSTPAVPPVDYCEQLKQQLAPGAATPNGAMGR